MKGKRKSKDSGFSDPKISKSLSHFHSVSEIPHQNKEVNPGRGRHKMQDIEDPTKRRGEEKVQENDEGGSQDDSCEQAYRAGSRRDLFRADKINRLSNVCEDTERDTQSGDS